MKEAIVNTDISVTVKDSPIPTPGPGELLIKVIVSGTNPKDWKLPHWMNTPSNSGDDVAGTIEAVGSEVYEFAKGDRVAGFHVMRTEHGSFAEYAIVPAFSAFHIPKSVSYEEAATVPLAAYTAATALFHSLELPSPWDRTRAKKTPVIIYGPCFRVFDTVSENGSFEMLGKAIAGPPEEGTGFKPRVTTVLPGRDFSAIDKSVEVITTSVGHVHEEEGEGRLFGLIWARVFAEGLRTGWMKAHPFEVIEGLQGVERALKGLQNGTVRAKKMVIRVAEGN
ncbi:trans-enoyl reductase lepG [Colletotrichum spaethianum]|uniref:Trans-enoyl reductase lepG n=1 Tax=Colletotrichum spaethianum TaxID=700344 RepID=A0AA37L2F4_9PEZI|nr:trans-enoyl reductase lepG [Colletotrichum spaethianum]GKT40622.1 trans-enoyl reductase lepG [Colletotrichum spaethianum]